jgi:hypothetical protein
VPIVLAVSGLAVTKMQEAGSGATLMEERLGSLTDPGPFRQLVLLDDQARERGRFAPPAGWSLIDFARHASGETSLALATARDVRVMRIDAAGAVLIDMLLVDEQAATDPFYDQGGVHDDSALVPVLTRDAVRLAALGESAIVALRTGRNAAIAYRFDRAGTTYVRAWRALVEPGLSVFAIGITSGTFDTFDQLKNHWQVFVDADAAGIAVAVPSREQFAPVFERHAAYFGEPVQAVNGALLTRLTPAGQRLGTTVIDTGTTGELHGLRVHGASAVLVGRVFSAQRADGGGWDAWFARIGRDDGARLAYRPIDVDRGEILFDTGALPADRFIAVGAAGYTQNPTGASVSEDTAPMLLILEADGSVSQRLPFPSGPRHNELRSLALRGSTWTVAGLVNGPGTHSGDGNPALIAADGIVQPLTLP